MLCEVSHVVLVSLFLIVKHNFTSFSRVFIVDSGQANVCWGCFNSLTFYRHLLFINGITLISTRLYVSEEFNE